MKYQSFGQFWHWEVEQRWIMSRFNPRAIRPGDVFENCDYRPMLCIENNYGDIEGISLIDGTRGGCSAFHCAPVKIDKTKVEDAIKNFNEGLVK